MDPTKLRDLLERVRSGAESVDEAARSIAVAPFRDIEGASVDHHRALRQGVPEVVFGERKTTAQIVGIARQLLATGQNVLVTRLDAPRAAEVAAQLPGFRYVEAARIGRLDLAPPTPRGATIAIVTAGTSDIPVAEEAAETLDAVGLTPARHYDVGVAGLHRLLHRLDALHQVDALIVVAGMEGALPSVVAGLVSTPVIAVPTSVGYGTAMGGLTALFAMLTSCANGVTAVNIDGGFAAAMVAHRIISGREARKSKNVGA
jgi:pyridinium-3,5-biscarboxylic acid mononucleotide synthase